MHFTVILLALVVQRYVGWVSHALLTGWLRAYVGWMKRHCRFAEQQSDLIHLAILLLPIFMGVGLIFIVLDAGGNTVLWLLVALLLLWLSTDARDGCRLEALQTPDALLRHSLRHVFAPFFWFGLFGPSLLAVYVTLTVIADLSTSEDAEATVCLPVSQTVLEWMNWLPGRLLVLTFAVAGHFSAVFGVWQQALRQPSLATDAVLLQSAGAALSSEQSVTPTREAVVQLLNRALVIVLVAGALISLGLLFRSAV